MDRCDAVFQPRNVQQSLLQIELIPAQADEFRDTQAMTIGDQDQGGIARAMAAAARRRRISAVTSLSDRYSRLR